jgi:hypothetical protein
MVLTECNREWLLKNSVIGMSFLAGIIAAVEFFLSPLKW